MAAAPAEDPSKKEEELEEEPTRPTTTCEVFQWADSYDITIMIVGGVLALANGVTLPMFAIFFGDLIDQIAVADEETLLDEVRDIAILFGVLGVATLIASYMETTLFMLAADNYVMRAREDYLKALLRQPAEYYDTHPAEAVAGRMAEDTIAMRNGLGAKLGQGIHFGSSCIAGLAVGFYFSWEMSLLMFGLIPVAMVGGFLIEWSGDELERKLSDAYAYAGQAATEAIAAIRTVAAFGRERTELQRYRKRLETAEEAGIKKQYYFGLGMGVFMCMFGIAYGVCLWFGGWLIVRDRNDNPTVCRVPLPPTDKCMTGGVANNVLLSVLIGMFSLAQAAPNLAAFFTAKTKVARVLELRERVPEIDVSTDSGNKVGLDKVRGALSFKDVTFAYPSRPEHKVLDKFSLEIQPGETVALVGGSGSGKSTALQLLQRLYDPQSGQVQLDGQDIRSLNVNSYRRVLGVVQQEPALFMASIGENIKFGRSSADNADEIPQNEVEHASKVAVAHDFITQLKQGYDSYVGEGGSTVSGGQKQRIAIARSVIRAPRVFLDDESTSALDTHSEKMLQESFASMRRDAREQGRPFTQVIVAHRLSTVKGADKIVVMEHGRIVQQGTHEELMQEHDGAYYRLYRASAVDNLDDDDDDDVDEAEEVAGKGAAAVLAMEQEDEKPAAAAAAGNASGAVAVSAVSPKLSAVSPEKQQPQEEKAAGKGKTDDDDKDEEEEEEEELNDDEYDEMLLKEAEKLPDPGSMRVWYYSSEEWGYLAIGMICAALNGATFPLIGYFFGDLVEGFYFEDDELEDRTTRFMAYLVVCGFAAFLAQWGQFWAFGVVGERMTRRIRVDYYAAILRCEAGFFDERRNSTGRLAARLAGDCAMVRSTLGEKYALYVQTLFAMVIGTALAFTRSWRVSLVVLAMAPLMVVAGMLESAALMGGSGGKDSEYEASGDVAGEAVTNIRTVHAFSMHGAIMKLFKVAGDKAKDLLALQAWMAGLSFGVSQCLQFAIFAVVFYVGAIFIKDGYITIGDLLSAVFSILWAAYGAGQAAAFATDAAKAEPAKRSIFSLIDRVKPIDPLNQEGTMLNPAEVRGEVELRGVSLAYPTRPNEWVLNNVSLTLKAGTVNALVGPSGSGKSTIVKLLLKQYVPQKGKVLFDGMDVQTINTASLRAALGFVQQEPVLLPGTVGFSIGYGLPDEAEALRRQDRAAGRGDTDGEGSTSTGGRAQGGAASELMAQGADTVRWLDEEAPLGVMPSIREACLLANAAEFVENEKTMPQGYKTEVGSASGAKVSGGQKQRICIARALVRKPKLLIFDESTSALDSRSQDVVMKTIDDLTTKAKEQEARTGQAGFTTVQIAHRLTTIQSSDQIVVMAEGKVVDAGTHDELLGRCELYQKLWRLSGADDSSRPASSRAGRRSAAASASAAAAPSPSGGAGKGDAAAGAAGAEL